MAPLGVDEVEEAGEGEEEIARDGESATAAISLDSPGDVEHEEAQRAVPDGDGRQVEGTELPREEAHGHDAQDSHDQAPEEEEGEAGAGGATRSGPLLGVQEVPLSGKEVGESRAEPEDSEEDACEEEVDCKER